MYIESDIIRGHIDAVVLHFLKDNDSYGYELSKLITDKTNGEYEINGQTLYSAIRRLESKKLIEGYWGDESQGGRRKYYRITEEGRKFLEEEREIWLFTKKIIDKLLDVE